MLALLSPAKIMDFSTPSHITTYSIPEFISEAHEIICLLRNMNMEELGKLLQINSQLTQLNFDRIFNWHQPFGLHNAKQAALAFDGEAYRGLNTATLTEVDMQYAQEHLLLLSGLYGVLRPLDLIQPYRLEVSSRLKNSAGKDLYAYWREKVTQYILQSLAQSGEPSVILNLASAEYFKTLDLKKNPTRVIDVEFYQYKNDQFKQVVMHTKKARGMMARYLIQNRIETEEGLKGFDADGYWFNPQLSTEDKLAFVR